MPTYELEQYELHCMKYTVEATDEADAIAKLFAGGADPVEQSDEYIEVAEDYGMPADQHQELAQQLRKRGITPVADVIPSIRSIEEVK